MWYKILKWLKLIDGKIENLCSTPKPVYRMETRVTDEKKQIATIDVYKDEVFSHSVDIFYLTGEQADELAKIQDGLHRKNRGDSTNTPG